MAKMGRPRIEINKTQFETLCGLQCTLIEIAGVFQCCEDTIETWCKRTYNSTFSEVYKIYSQHGKVSLRRYQYKLAEKYPAMAIFLGKQYLDQKDDIRINADNEGMNITLQITDTSKKDGC